VQDGSDKKLKGWDKLGTSNKDAPTGIREPFSLDGFYQQLIKWIVDHCWHWVVFPPEKLISRHVL